MKKIVPYSLQTIVLYIVVVFLAAIIGVGYFSSNVVTDTLRVNAEQTALMHLKSMDAVLLEKTKNIQRFVDLVSNDERLESLVMQENADVDLVNTYLRDVIEEFSDIEACIISKEFEKNFSFNLQNLSEDDILQLHVSCPLVSEKRGELNWFKINLSQLQKPMFNDYVICATNIFKTASVKFYVFVDKDIFSQIINASMGHTVSTMLDGNGRVIASNDEDTFMSLFNSDNENLMRAYSNEEGLFDFSWDNEEYIGVHYMSNITGFKFLEFYKENELYNDVNKIFGFVLLILLCCLVLIAVLYLLLYKQFLSPIRRLSSIMRNFNDDSLNSKINVGGSNEVGEIANGFNIMIDNMNEIIYDAKEKEIKKKQAEIDALRYQIHPHFVYNTLNSVRILALTGTPTDTAKSIQLLANILKRTFTSGDFVTLEEEFDFTKDYMELLQVRYKNMIDCTMNIEEELKDCMVPTMLLQPVVENAVTHGFSEKLEMHDPVARLTIETRTEDNNLIIDIVDNGVGINREKIEAILNGNAQSNNSVGLSNIMERIKLLYGDGYGLSITSKEKIFTCISIKLPQVRSFIGTGKHK